MRSCLTPWPQWLIGGGLVPALLLLSGTFAAALAGPALYWRPASTGLPSDVEALAATLAQSFSGAVTLTDSTGTIAPGLVTFTLGVARPDVTIGAGMAEVVISTTLGSAAGNSNRFAVLVPWRIFLPLVARQALSR